MNKAEYLKIKDYTYLEYCDYLQNKYGIGIADYMTKSYKKTGKASRTKEGLYVHHKTENIAPRLSKPEIAEHFPIEYQAKENLVYCDALEHLLLHTMICKNSDWADIGIGGICEFLIPELNDWYSGFVPSLAWQQNCCNRVKDDREVFLHIIDQFLNIMREDKDELDVYEFNFYKIRPSYYWESENNLDIIGEELELGEKYDLM